MFRSDFYFFDFFAENFSFFENPTSENPKISVTIGFPIVILGRKSSKKPTSDFWESRTTLGTAVVHKEGLNAGYGGLYAPQSHKYGSEEVLKTKI